MNLNKYCFDNNCWCRYLRTVLPPFPVFINVLHKPNHIFSKNDWHFPNYACSPLQTVHYKINMPLAKLMVFHLIISVQTLRECNNDRYTITYHKIKSCYKSKEAIIAWKNLPNVRDCMDFVKERRGFAFNHSPAQAKNYTRGYFKNCQVLGCPDTSNASLDFDLGFDYYSAYGNLTSTFVIYLLFSQIPLHSF